MNFNLKLTEHVNGSYGELNDESNNITGAGELVDSLLGHVHVGGLELVRVDGEVLHIPLRPLPGKIFLEIVLSRKLL